MVRTLSAAETTETDSPPLAIPVAVTGAHGFIGTRLSAALAAAGATVSQFGRGSRDGRDRLMRAEDVRVHFHLATSVDPSTAERFPERVAADRAEFARLLDGFAGLARPPLVVLASSGPYVYDPTGPQPFAETAPLGPRTEYGRAKLALEQELRDRADVVPGLALRLASVYGPTQPAGSGQGVIVHWLAAATRGRPPRLSADLAQSQDFVHVDDVVDALVRIGRLAQEALPAVLNIGSGAPTSLDDLLRMLTGLAGGAIAVERVAGRGFERRDAVLDIRLAAECLGWAPRIALTTGLAQVWRAQVSGGSE